MQVDRLIQSYAYVAMQIANIVVGLFTILYVAKKLDPITFSIYAIYNIILIFYMTFSYVGYETHLIRNTLNWETNNQHKKIKNLITYTIISRIILGVVLFIPACSYLYFISIKKYNGEHNTLLVSFVIAGFFSALSNSAGLILRAFNKYVLAFGISTMTITAVRMLALLIFIKFGFEEFMYVLILSPIVTFAIGYLCIKKYIDYKMFRWSKFFKFKRYKYFAMSGYLGYVKGSVDQVLISLLLSIEVLSVYNIARKIEEIGVSILEGFFDPIIQKMVQIKNNNEELHKNEIYINKIIKYAILFYFTSNLIFNFEIDVIIRLIGLNSYKNLETSLLIASWTPMLYLCYKVEWDKFHLFEKQRKIFNIDLIAAVMLIIFFVAFAIAFNNEYIYMHKIAFSLLMIFVFKSKISNKFLYFVERVKT